MTDIHTLMGSRVNTGWFFGGELAWQTHAACSKQDEVPAEKFFPGRGAPSQKGKRLCGACPVRDECLDWALVHDEHGIWGGLTERERQRLVLERLPIFTKGTK